jgi:hypothetical protein
VHRSNYKIGGILRDIAGNLQVTWSWRGRKGVFVFVVAKTRDRDWKTTVIVFVKAKETRSCCGNLISNTIIYRAVTGDPGGVIYIGLSFTTFFKQPFAA